MLLRNSRILKLLKAMVKEEKHFQLEQLLRSNINNQDLKGGSMANFSRRVKKSNLKVYKEVVFDVADKEAKMGT